MRLAAMNAPNEVLPMLTTPSTAQNCRSAALSSKCSENISISGTALSASVDAGTSVAAASPNST